MSTSGAGTRAGTAGQPPAPPTHRPLVAEDDARYVQHRCHPRLEDMLHTAMDLNAAGLRERWAVMMACYRSAPGQEPTAPPTLHPPEYYRLRFKSAEAAAAGRNIVVLHRPLPEGAGAGAGAGAAAGGGSGGSTSSSTGAAR